MKSYNSYGGKDLYTVNIDLVWNDWSALHSNHLSPRQRDPGAY